MTEVKISDLSELALNWAVARCEGGEFQHQSAGAPPWIWPSNFVRDAESPPNYATSWADAGPVIQRIGIDLMLRSCARTPGHMDADTWDATIKPEFYSSARPKTGVKTEHIMSGSTALIAAMRCYVKSRLGPTLEIPDDLLADPDKTTHAAPISPRRCTP